MNFWKNLKKPIMVLAPLADVTDPAFRRVIAKYGKPDVMWTEFVSADGLFLGGYDHLINDLTYTESERPIVAQFFTSRPEMMRKAAELAVDLGFDGIDINMGCPDKSIEKQGAGAAHIKDYKQAQEIILAAKAGALAAFQRSDLKNQMSKGQTLGPIPVSVKTRIGYNKNEIETWIPALLETNPAVITIHARTRKEMSLVPAQWDNVKRAVEIRNELKSDTLIFGNGDVTDLDHARKRVEETGCDGVMLGRAIFGNPFLFSSLHFENKNVPSEVGGQITPEQKLRVMVEHTKLFSELLPHKSFAIMKKHYKAYVTGWDKARELRMQLMEAQNAEDVE